MRYRAPEAFSTGSDNPGAAAIWAGLLLRQIGSAVTRKVALLCGVGGAVADHSGRPASP